MLLLVAGVRAQGPKSPAVAKIGAHRSGYNYEYGVLCAAGAELPAAFKAKKQLTFAGGRLGV